MWIEIPEEFLGLRAGELKRHADVQNAIIECNRRYQKSLRLGYDNADMYKSILNKLQVRLAQGLENNTLTLGYAAKNNQGFTGTRKQRGTEADGLFWEPYFRMWLPAEAFEVISPIGELKGKWNNSTLKAGKEHFNGDVAACRREWMLNGSALAMCNEYGLPHMLDSLVLSYGKRS